MVRDVTVVDVEHARLLRNQTVVVEGDRITALGPTESVRVPNGASVVEGTGRFVVPGFVDMHVHLHRGRSRHLREQWSHDRPEHGR